MFLPGIILQRSARILDLLLITQSHTLIFSLPFPSDTRVSVDNEHPSSSTNYRKRQSHQIKKNIRTHYTLFLFLISPPLPPPTKKIKIKNKI